MALQMARNIASGGQANVLYICFEHDEQYLLNRLIAMESALAHLPHKTGAIKIQDVRKEILGTWMAEGGGARRSSPQPAPAAVASTASRATARTCSCCAARRPPARSTTSAGSSSSIASCRATGGSSCSWTTSRRCRCIPEPETRVREGHLRRQRPQGHRPVRRGADDRDRGGRQGGPKAARLRNFHLRGSSAINYEADIILILNEKYNIVAKVNIEFNPYQAQRFRDWVVVSVEKNRGGLDNVDLEFEKHFEFSCFDPSGRTVQEKLIEERLYND